MNATSGVAMQLRMIRRTPTACKPMFGLRSAAAAINRHASPESGSEPGASTPAAHARGRPSVRIDEPPHYVALESPASTIFRNNSVSIPISSASKTFLTCLPEVATSSAIAFSTSFVGTGEKDEPPFAPPIRALAAAPMTALAQVARLTPEQLRERLAQAGVKSTSDQQTLGELVGPDMRKQVHVLGTLFGAAN